MSQHMKIAELNDEQVSKIQSLETDLGAHVMAFDGSHQLADLNDEQMEKLQALENELGVTLVVYQG